MFIVKKYIQIISYLLLAHASTSQNPPDEPNQIWDANGLFRIGLGQVQELDQYNRKQYVLILFPVSDQ